MKRKNNYLIIKRSDISKYCNDEEKEMLSSASLMIDDCREADGKEMLKAVVVEHDWPEYEQTWKAIESRVDGVEFLNPDNAMIMQSEDQWYKFAAFILNKLAPSGVSVSVDDMRPFKDGDKCILAHGHHDSIEFKIVTRAEAEALLEFEKSKSGGMQ